jgi:dCTP diphosphatase
MKKLEKDVYNYLKERNWHTLSPANLAKSISIEAAELLELFQWDNPELKDVLKNKEKIEQVKKEVADVLIYSLELSVLLKLDTEKIIRDKLAYTAKKYPAKLMRKSRKPGTEDIYWKIKKEHRTKGLS